MTTHCLQHATGLGWSASAAAITSALGLALLGCADDSTGGESGTQPAQFASTHEGSETAAPHPFAGDEAWIAIQTDDRTGAEGALALGSQDPPASVAASEGEAPPWSGHRIAFTRSHTGDDSVVWTARPDGSHQRKVFRGPVYFPAWVPNHRRLVFDFPDDEGGEQIATVRTNGSHFRQLTDLPGISESPDYAPGGRRIIFGRFSPDQPSFYTSLWVMRADATHKHALFGPDSSTFDVEPEYAPDGSKIVFARLSARSDYEKTAVFVVNADGSHPRRITPYTVGLEHPRWSPDGRRIVYNIIDSRTAKDGIYLVRANGENRHRVFRSDRFLGFKPDFSPNGKRILFGCFVVSEEQDDLCVMRADGTRAHRIVRTPRVFENFPVWR